jgi:transposase
MTICELPDDIDILKQLVLDTHQQVVERDDRIAERDQCIARHEERIAQHEERIAQQTEQLTERDEWLAEREAEIKDLESQIAYLKHKLFGRCGEKIDPQQLLLFNELKAKAEALQQEAETEEICYTRRKGHGRNPLPDNLPVEEVQHPLEDIGCPCCGEAMQTIGQETTDELEYNPGSLFIRRHIRPKYACRKCEQGVHIAPMPPRAIDKGIAGPGMLAYLLTSKFADHIPLNRFRKILRRSGIELAESTLCDWVARMSDLLTPIYDDWRTQLLAGRLIQSDDTEVPYLLKSLKKQTATGYLWTYLCESSKLVLYDFTTSRGRAGPSTFLAGFVGGTLQTDGYVGYDEIVERAELVRAGCWAHARRKYYDARRDDRVRCGRMLKLIQALFVVEQKAKALRADPEARFGDVEHLALRQEESKPLLDKIKVCTEDWSLEVLPRSSVGKAVTYMRNQWKPLTRFLEDPQLQLDNNASERAMRHVVLGRKNWTFAGSAEGGHRAAKIYSIIATCQQQGLDPFAYLRDVIDRLPRGHEPATLTPAAWKSEQLDAHPAHTAAP